jgi:DNA-binding CsgD family transcriptional regulator
MKSIQVTLDVTVNESTYNDLIAQGFTPEQIKNKIEDSINSAKIKFSLIHDFIVERMGEFKD